VALGQLRSGISALTCVPGEIPVTFDVASCRSKPRVAPRSPRLRPTRLSALRARRSRVGIIRGRRREAVARPRPRRGGPAPHRRRRASDEGLYPCSAWSRMGETARLAACRKWGISAAGLVKPSRSSNDSKLRVGIRRRRASSGVVQPWSGAPPPGLGFWLRAASSILSQVGCRMLRVSARRMQRGAR
jgi:hypothetical protein